ncbi:MAG TPA: SPOR domain-containing protein [Methylophilaceae bacterium]|nr:SPOR domain-containing protein [Methylophilaceae bacterium]HQR60496.1 SPOR domain-containing protein [Methylophilaceae bacterium]
MTRDYKPAATRSKPAGKSSPFITGLLIGLILGIGVSIAVAIMLRGGGNPFAVTTPPTVVTAPPDTGNATPPDALQQQQPAEKPRFDFYTILPGTETAVTEQQVQQSAAAQPGTPSEAGSKNYFLQVGAFQNEQDADNLKAQLALLGLEAVVQTANLPDKGVSHRVRVGPLTDIEQIRKARTELTKNGFSPFLIQQNSMTPDQ